MNSKNYESLQKSGKIAGVMFIFTFAVSLLYGGILFPQFTSKDALSVTGNMITNESLFRFCIITEILGSFLAVLFTAILYGLFKSVNKSLSLFAASIKVIEAVLLSIIALGHYTALLLLKNESLAGSNQIQIIIGEFINMNFSTGIFIMIFHGLNLTIFLYLFLKSNYIPKALAVFGIFSYISILIFALTYLIVPDHTITLIIQIISFGSSILTELVIGSWLIIKGLYLNKGEEQ